MLSGNIFCAHCGGRITTTHHKDHYFRKDGSEYLKDELKYRCYHKANKLCECEGQTNYIAARVDEAVCQMSASKLNLSITAGLLQIKIFILKNITM